MPKILKQKLSFPLFLPFAFLFLLVLGFFLSKPPDRSREARTAGNLILPQGKQTYIIQSNPQSPRFIKATIDPLDVKVGDVQTMEVGIEDADAPIVSVRADIETDIGTTTQTLSLKEGNASKGTWSGFWIVRDTHSKIYRTTFTATNAKQEQTSITLTWSDPCTPPLGGDWTLDGNCAISGVDGVDNGNFTVSNYTLTLNAGATFVWNPTRNITITNGALAIADTAKLQKTYLWMEDGDTDGYPANTTQVAADTQPASHRRRSVITTVSTTDCSDIDINAWRFRYGIASCQQTGPHCVGNQSGYYDSPKFYVFQSVFSFGGDLAGGIPSVESWCNWSANAASSLGGSYTAWVADSPSNEPRDRGLSSCAAAGANSLPWYLPDGVTKIADNWADLTDGSIDAFIDKSVSGYPGSSITWSCVAYDGSATFGCSASYHDCNNWTSGTGHPNYGRIGAPNAATDQKWSDIYYGGSYGTDSSQNVSQPCNFAKPVLCFQHAP